MKLLFISSTPYHHLEGGREGGREGVHEGGRVDGRITCAKPAYSLLTLM